MPGVKLYVVNSVELIGAVQRYHKTLAFPPIEAKMGKRMSGCSEEADKVIMTNVNGDDGDSSMSIESFKVIRSALTPGEDLDMMNRTMIRNIASSCEKIRPSDVDSPVKLNLREWLRHEITMATTNAVYGPMNPYVDRHVEDSFWYGPSDSQFKSHVLY